VVGRKERKEIGRKRLVNILEKHTIALGRTLEQKIADAGPYNQRIQPHILTECRRELIQEGRIHRLEDGNTPWFHLNDASASEVKIRLAELKPIHAAIRAQNFTMRVGQALEIAVYRSLAAQTTLEFLGSHLIFDLAMPAYAPAPIYGAAGVRGQARRVSQRMARRVSRRSIGSERGERG